MPPNGGKNIVRDNKTKKILTIFSDSLNNIASGNFLRSKNKKTCCLSSPKFTVIILPLAISCVARILYLIAIKCPQFACNNALYRFLVFAC